MSNKIKTKKARNKVARKQRQNNANNATKLRKATALHNAGEFQEASILYKEILEKEPRNPDALNLSGLIAGNDGNFDTAKKLISLAIEASPNTPNFHCNLGLVHNDLGDFDNAIICYKRAIELKPDYIDAYFHMGNTLRLQQREEEAIENYKQTLRLKPDHLPALHNMGNSLRDSGLFDQALSCYKHVLQLDPNQAIAYTNMGNTYKDMRKPQEAVACYQKATEIAPDCADSYNNIGYILHRQGKLSAALPWLNKAIKIQPNNSAALHNIGNIYKDMGNFKKAIDVYHQALELNPCFAGAHSNILFAMNYAENIEPTAMIQEATKWWNQQASHLANQFTHTNEPEPKRRLKIGYISPDFYTHSVSFFFLTLIKSHDRKQVEVFCYSDVSIPDQMTTEIQKHSDQWRPVLGLSDKDVAQQIYDDQIDILVELTGHTANNRLLAMARQPAPIQVSWLGYPNTTGMPVIDYRLTDAIADPEGQADQFYSEKLTRLEHGFLCYTPPAETPPIDIRVKSKKHAITFVSFNNITKITPQVIKVWSEILKGTSNSKLILKGIIFADPESKASFFANFTQHGIAPNRLILRERTESTYDHLNLYNEVDIGLDPFPYNGTTTTCEALWMGVPVISLAGDVHCSRVGASILTQLGLTDFIAQTEDEYIRKAIDLAKDPNTLEKFRTSIRATMQESPLCTPELFAADMESAFRKMWGNWCNEKKPAIQKQTSNKQKDMLRKLHIGGTMKSSEWEVLNAVSGEHVDHLGDARDLSQFKDNIFSELYASHVIEHFDYKNALAEVLVEWKRVLIPGGRVLLSVPDMDVLAQLFLSKKLTLNERFMVMRMIFGGHVDEYDYHFVGLNEEFLITFMNQAGYVNIKRVESFDLFDDTSIMKYKGISISLNIIAEKPATTRTN